MISLLPLSTGHPPILHVSVQKLHKVASAFSSHSVDWANPCLLVFCWQGWFCDRISSKHLASWTLELDFKNVFSPLPLVGCPGFLCSPGGQIVFFIFNLVNACPRCRDSQRRTLSSLERCRPRESILLLLDPDPWSGLYSNPDPVSFDCRVISDHYAPCFHICLLCFLWPCLFCQGDYCRGAICLLPPANLLLLLPSWLHWTVPRQLPLHKWLMMITCPFWYIYLFIWLIKLVFIKYNDDTLSILISKITNICLIKVVFITSHFLTDNWGMLWWKW